MLAGGRALVEEVRAFDLRQRTIRLAACAPAPLRLLRDLLAELSPSRHLTCGIREEDAAAKDLPAGHLDLAVFHAPAEDPLLVSAVCCREQLCVLVLPGHPLAEKSALLFRDLAGVPMLQYKDAGFWVDLCRRTIPDARLILQEDRKTFLELASTSALPRFYTALFNRFKAQDVSGQRILPIEDPEASVTYHLATRREDIARYRALFDRLPGAVQALS